MRLDFLKRVFGKPEPSAEKSPPSVRERLKAVQKLDAALVFGKSRYSCVLNGPWLGRFGRTDRDTDEGPYKATCSFYLDNLPPGLDLAKIQTDFVVETEMGSIRRGRVKDVRGHGLWFCLGEISAPAKRFWRVQ